MFNLFLISVFPWKTVLLPCQPMSCFPMNKFVLREIYRQQSYSSFYYCEMLEKKDSVDIFNLLYGEQWICFEKLFVVLICHSFVWQRAVNVLRNCLSCKFFVLVMRSERKTVLFATHEGVLYRVCLAPPLLTVALCMWSQTASHSAIQPVSHSLAPHHHHRHSHPQALNSPSVGESNKSHTLFSL